MFRFLFSDIGHMNAIFLAVLFVLAVGFSFLFFFEPILLQIILGDLARYPLILPALFLLGAARIFVPRISRYREQQRHMEQLRDRLAREQGPKRQVGLGHSAPESNEADIKKAREEAIEQPPSETSSRKNFYVSQRKAGTKDDIIGFIAQILVNQKAALIGFVLLGAVFFSAEVYFLTQTLQGITLITSGAPRSPDAFTPIAESLPTQPASATSTGSSTVLPVATETPAVTTSTLTTQTAVEPSGTSTETLTPERTPNAVSPGDIPRPDRSVSAEAILALALISVSGLLFLWVFVSILFRIREEIFSWAESLRIRLTAAVKQKLALMKLLLDGIRGAVAAARVSVLSLAQRCQISVSGLVAALASTASRIAAKVHESTVPTKSPVPARKNIAFFVILAIASTGILFFVSRGFQLPWVPPAPEPQTPLPLLPEQPAIPSMQKPTPVVATSTTETAAPSKPEPQEAVVVNRVETAKNVIALTFDADMTTTMRKQMESGAVGSWYSKEVIDILRAEQIPSTLFLTGMWAELYPTTTRELATDPLFEIAAHGYSHAAFSSPCYDLPVLPNDQNEAELARMEQVLGEYAPGFKHYFRFPGLCYEQGDLELVARRGYRVIHGDITSGDAFSRNTERIARNVVDGARSGSIVMFNLHGGPNAPKTAEALPEIIRALREKGFSFVKISDLLETAGR